jgi:hypothetical protein
MHGGFNLVFGAGRAHTFGGHGIIAMQGMGHEGIDAFCDAGRPSGFIAYFRRTGSAGGMAK